MLGLLLLLSTSMANAHQVAPYIEVIDTYSESISKDQFGITLQAKAASNVIAGDMLILVVETRNGTQKKLPKGFHEIHREKKGKDLTVVLAVKEYFKDDPLIYEVNKEAESYSVSLITIRGPTLLVDAKGAVNSALGSRGRAITPEVETIKGGAVISVFAYDDPHAVKVKGMKTLVSKPHIAIAIGPTKDGKHKRIEARAGIPKLGKGNDIAIALSIY